MILDINPGSSSSLPSRFVDVNGDILFIASTPATGAELWRTDGTPTGTHLVKDIWPGQPQSSLNWLTAIDGTLFFTADDGVHGHELWKSDGSEAGTVLIKDIDPGPNNGLYPGLITELGGLVYFRADEPVTGQELWRTDGTEAGTVMVKDINPGSASSDISQMIVVNGQMLFWAVADTTGWTLWRSDGTETGTVLVKNIDPVFVPSALRAFYEVNGVAYFFAADTIHGGELWRTDCTEQGTWMVKDIRPDSASSWIAEMRVLGDGVIFSAFTDAQGRELWLSDGTEQGTNLVLDLYPGPEDGTIGLHNPVVVDGWLFFVGDDGTLMPPFGLYITNGTDTYLMTDGLSNMGGLSTACGGVFFDATDGVNGWELWYSNGTPDGTYMAADINTGLGTSHPNDFLDDGERLIFSASTSANGDEPWILPCSFVGTEELNEMPDLIIAPVPSRGLVSIELPLGDGPWEIRITDCMGRLVHQVQHASSSIVLDTNEWNSGVYQIVANDRTAQVMGRLVVEN